jgi:hypothetical protein
MQLLLLALAQRVAIALRPPGSPKTEYWLAVVTLETGAGQLGPMMPT